MIMAILLITGLSLLMYSRTLDYGYVSDDSSIKDSEAPVNKPTNIWWRDLHRSFMGVCYNNKAVDHAIPLILHTLNCLLIYFVFGKTSIALVTALLFLLNPVNLQAGIGLSGRFYSLSVTVVLLMLLFKIIAPVFYIAILTFNFSAILAPLLFLGTDYWYWVLLIPTMIFAYRTRIYNYEWEQTKLKLTTRGLTQMGWWRIVLGFKTFGYYTLHCLFPRKCGMYHQFMYTYGFTDEDNKKWQKVDKDFWIGVAVIATVAVGIITNFHGVRYGLLWWCLFIPQWCNFYKMYQQPVAERYEYLPNIGLMYALACLLGPVASLVVLGAYATRTDVQLGMFKDNLKWLEYNLYDFNFPKQHIAWLFRGLHEREKKRILAAIDCFAHGWEARPHDDKLNFNLGLSLLEIGQISLAYEHILEAEKNILELQNGGGGQMKQIIPQIKAEIEKRLAAKKEKEDAEKVLSC